MQAADLKDHIRDIPDFPQEGIIFKDITTLLKHPKAFKTCMDVLVDQYRDQNIQQIIGVESRGFIFGSVLAYQLGCGFVPMRKKGKLPGETVSVSYELEYGTDQLEIHADALEANTRVLIADDLLATGGTVEAAIKLLEQQNVTIAGIAFLVELSFLNGKERLSDHPVFSVVTY